MFKNKWTGRRIPLDTSMTSRFSPNALAPEQEELTACPKHEDHSSVSATDEVGVVVVRDIAPNPMRVIIVSFSAALGNSSWLPTGLLTCDDCILLTFHAAEASLILTFCG